MTHFRFLIPDFRKIGIFFFAFCFLKPAWAASVYADETGFLPPAHELFKPLLADPRELQYALRVISPVSHRSLAEVAIGDYLGAYRWALSDQAYFQISIGGGFFGRFDLAEQSNSLLVSDYYGNLPFDFRLNKWSFRFMPYHISSHLGDDYLKQTGGITSKHTWDNLRWIASYDVCTLGRVYGGYNYEFRELPQGFGRNALQAGFETYSPWMGNGHAQVYWANDFQSWQRTSWNPGFNSELGLKLMKDPHAARWISLFLGFGTGPQPQGQFFLNDETHWTLGIRFELS